MKRIDHQNSSSSDAKAKKNQILSFFVGGGEANRQNTQCGTLRAFPMKPQEVRNNKKRPYFLSGRLEKRRNSEKNLWARDRAKSVVSYIIDREDLPEISKKVAVDNVEKVTEIQKIANMSTEDILDHIFEEDAEVVMANFSRMCEESDI